MSHAVDRQFFRHEYGRLVALLSRRVGVRHVEAIEDAVQHALMTAVEAWPRGAQPDNPSAWLFRVAHNRLVEELRRDARRARLARQQEPVGFDAAEPTALLAGDVSDDMLRMLFVCCHDDIVIESQIVLALKTLSGFNVREIAERLFTTEANVYKRLGRARARLREVELDIGELSSEQLASRLPAVQLVLYLIFTEGYLSSHTDGAIRRDLCDEARRLALMLAEHPVSATPETSALVALMYLHGARMQARQDGSGGLLLLEEQDRALWSQEEIASGLQWLARSAEGDVFSRFHAEAGIAAEHCLAPSFEQTRWDRIVECYALLDRLAPSPIHTLNRAVAMAEWKGPAEGLALLDGLAPPTWLAGSYLWAAVLADLHRRRGHEDLAERHRRIALESAPSDVVRKALARRLTPVTLGAPGG
ncbi:MAG: sigma-70 family RNA polymerase sigma factor [Polyangiaceae bacterium]|nr:sigma-70 family RNA polymerase sigma factor [Polyangiaceae bacterium]